MPPVLVMLSLETHRCAGGTLMCLNTYVQGPSVRCFLSHSFAPFQKPEELVPLALQMFKDFDLLKCFNIPEAKMLKFIKRVKDGYRDNPFHSWYHGWSVMHAAFLILSKTAARAAFPPLEVLTLLTSALCHDLDHPGHNNAFEVQYAHPPLAK